jgi:hypothetical protein
MNYINSNGLLNLAAMNERTDEIVFDYIDTKPNWEKAYTNLDALLEESVKFFLDYVKQTGELPKAKTYWSLFLDLNTKLIYFSTLALSKNELKSKGISESVLANRFQFAINSLTNVHTEEGEQFLQEMIEGATAVSSGNPIIYDEALGIEERMARFYEFCKEY